MSKIETLLDWLAKYIPPLRTLLVLLAIGAPYVLFAVVIAFLLTPQKSVTIYTGTDGGLYADLGKAIQKKLTEHDSGFSKFVFNVKASDGDFQNIKAVEEGEADFAFAADGLPTSKNTVATVMPVSSACLHIVTRADTPYDSISSFSGAKLYLGKPDSGTRILAKAILDHYGIRDYYDRCQQQGFREAVETLENGTELDAAFILTSLRASSMKYAASTGKLKLVPVDRAEGIERAFGYLHKDVIPIGTYSAAEVFPNQDTPTVSVQQLLICNKNLPADQVRTTAEVAALTKRELASTFPLLDVPRDAITEMFSYPMHEGAVAFFEKRPLSEKAFTIILGFLLVAIGQVLAGFYYLRYYLFRKRERTLFGDVDETQSSEDDFNVGRLKEVLFEALELYRDRKLDREGYLRIKEYVTIRSSSAEASSLPATSALEKEEGEDAGGVAQS